MVIFALRWGESFLHFHASGRFNENTLQQIHVPQNLDCSMSQRLVALVLGPVSQLRAEA